MLKVACIGIGFFSQFHLDAWARLERVRLVAVCDRDKAKAEQAGGHYDARAYGDTADLLSAEDVDIVDIIAPPSSHASFIRQSLRPDRTIICQKPFCCGLEEASTMAAEAEEAGTLLVVHENFRFQPWYRKIKTILDRGLLGAVYQATFRLRPGDGQGPDAYLSRQPYFQTMPRFLIHETGIHFIDTFRFLFGAIESVYADLRTLNPVIAGEDAGHLILSHESGVRTVFDGNRLVGHPAENRRKTMGELIIEGSNAVLRLDGDGRLFLRQAEENSEEEIAFAHTDRGFGGDCVMALQSHVVAHLLDGAPLENTARDYLANLRVEAAAYQSAETGARIAL